MRDFSVNVAWFDADVYESLILNALLLIAFASIYSILHFKNDHKHIAFQILKGSVIGLAVIFIMSKSIEYAPGYFYDSRSIVYITSATFYGFIPTVIAVVMGIAFRIHLGGAGVVLAIIEIFISSSVALSWPRIKKRLPKMHKVVDYLCLSFLVHVLIMIEFLIFNETRSQVMPFVIPTLILFTLASLVISLIIDRQLKHVILIKKMRNQNRILNAAMNSAMGMEMYVIDTDYRYIDFNEYHQMIIKKHLNIDIKIGDSFLDTIRNLEAKEMIKQATDKALSGVSHMFVDSLKEFGAYTDAHFVPVFDDDNHVIGAAMFVRDVTKQKKDEYEVLWLSNHDTLTKVYNRRYYETELNRLVKAGKKLALVYIDINGLKMVNDTFGHTAGDTLLETAATKLNESFQSHGFVARIGGDEFVAVVNGLDKAEVLNKVEKAKEILNKTKVCDIGISISYGIATKDRKTSLNEALKTAEDKMYKYKFFESASHRNENIKIILDILKARNSEEEKHAERVASICFKIGEKLNMTKNDIYLLKLIANLHDIGQIAIDDQILNKAGTLTKSEFDAMKRHPEIGFKILASAPQYSAIAYDVLSHHERYDGKGYPNGMKGEDIPIRARIVSVADAYDAMRTNRPYRSALTKEEAIKELTKNKGTQFDPLIVDIWVSILNEKNIN